MQVFQDPLGVPVSASSVDSALAFHQVIEGYLASRKAVMPNLELLIESDPEMPLARCFRAYLLKLAADSRFQPAAEALSARLSSEAGHLTPREQAHVRALESWLANDLDTTTRILEDVLVDHPRDMLALRIAHYLHFYAGGAGDMSDSVIRSLKHWQPTDDFYGYLLGMHAFGLEESGHYREAEAAGKQAVELNTEDIWAAHAVTHVFQMQSRFAEGVPWVETLLPTWPTANNFVYHMHWHKALCHIGLGELDAALDIYDVHLEAAVNDDFYLDVCNAASLLWRLEMLGMNVGDRWQPLMKFSAPRVTDGELLFCTLHYMMPPARLNDGDVIDKGLQHFAEWAKQGSTQGQLCQVVGQPLASAIVDFGRGDLEAAREKISAVQDDIRLIGGSHAQRDLFNLFRDHVA